MIVGIKNYIFRLHDLHTFLSLNEDELIMTYRYLFRKVTSYLLRILVLDEILDLPPLPLRNPSGIGTP
jgi:hypothetical protein